MKWFLFQSASHKDNNVWMFENGGSNLCIDYWRWRFQLEIKLYNVCWIMARNLSPNEFGCNGLLNLCWWPHCVANSRRLTALERKWKQEEEESPEGSFAREKGWNEPWRKEASTIKPSALQKQCQAGVVSTLSSIIGYPGVYHPSYHLLLTIVRLFPRRPVTPPMPASQHIRWLSFNGRTHTSTCCWTSKHAISHSRRQALRNPHCIP